MTAEGKRTLRVAIGEFFVILVGVLAALGAQAFWEYRVERREERESLFSLREEFVASRASLASGSQQWHGYVTAGRGLLGWLGPDPAAPSGDSIAREVERAIVGYTTYNDHRGVLDGLIASGGLRVIQNDSLRAMLAGWPAVVDDLTEDEDLAIEFRNHELVPYVYERLPVEGSRFPRDVRPLLADPYFERLMYRRILGLEVILDAYDAALTEAESILAVLDEELGDE